ncbi:unnamed protein product [Ceutorhynchus assimilis]|uniref:Uncharacterized protein n=1 Tax=Ceutorhynchus assimilis TaxID=467358 RepID=A0A9N9QK74_9CUCU|nr:unnamed protein product [Ceutorhynchus assimilis]
MILRKERRLFLAICILIVKVRAQGERTYDTSEWIPITPTTLEARGSENVEQVANDRVLSLDAPAQQKFFPDNEFDYRKRRPNQVQQFISAPKKVFEQPRPRKLKHPLEYKFETPPPPPSKNQPQINYYNGQNMSPYQQQNFYQQQKRPSNPQAQYKRPGTVPNNLQAPYQQQAQYQSPKRPDYYAEVPAPNALNHYEQYQLPFNSSFYQSLNPTNINNGFYQAINNNSQSNAAVEQETVQLVYVPVENLQSNQQNNRQQYQQQSTPNQEYSQQIYQQQAVTTAPEKQVYQATPSYNSLDFPRQAPILSQNQDSSFILDSPQQEKLISLPDNKQAKLERIEQDFLQQALQASRLQEQFRDDINPIKQEVVSSTAKPKQKPHQPPLSLFLNSEKKAEISDVLSILRDAKTISVQDTITHDSPQVFIGPSNLDSAEGYNKFPLPYLNNINGNRIERKIDQLPFFVAPVSYKTPPGYSKIALPSPHVGSVVVSLPINTTPEPQYSPFGYQSSRAPAQENIDTYSLFDTRSTTQSSPVRNIFEQAYTPNDYYLQQSPQYSTQEERQNTSPRSQQITKLPDINPLELAINEFELHQINDQAEEHNKVKHSTTSRPQTNYETTQSARSSQTRGRHNYDNEATTERSRGRVRGRGRATSRTTTTTTQAPIETDRYTVLEEFVARNPSSDTYRNPSTESYRSPSTDSYRSPSTESYRSPSTENYRIPSTDSYRSPSTESYRSSSVEVETEPSRKSSTTPFSGNPYLPDSQTQSNVRQLYDDLRNIQFETPKAPTDDEQELKRQPQTEQSVNRYYPENIQANDYNLGQFQYENIAPNNEIRTTTEKPKVDEEVIPTHLHRFSPEVISYENREPNQQRRPAHQQYASDDVRANYQQQYEVDVNEPQLTQTESYQRPQETSEEDSRRKPFPDPTSFIDNLNRPNFDDTYISLQDQAVRSLLVPNLLAPSTKSQFSTESIIELQPSTEAETTTTTKASRTRSRGRTRLSTTESSVATSPRRASNRRRPVSTTSTENYSSGRDSNVKQQKFRTRGRPTQNEIVDRVSTTENEVKAFKESLPQTDFEPVKSREPPQSYMQFEHAIEDQQIITINPLQEDIKEYHQVYELPQQNQQVLEYDNTRSQPIVDVQVSHVLPEDEPKLDIITKAPEEEVYVRPTNANIRSGGVLNNNREEQATRASTARPRGRTRTRSRFASSTSTTTRPVTRISPRYTTGKPRETTTKEEQEFYGFTRQPAYTPANLNIQAEPQVKFVGEIRPKYSPRTTTSSSAEAESSAETARPRIRSRTRAPTRKTSSTYRQSDNDVYNGRSTEQATRRSSPTTTRTRTRGSSHYRAPENQKRESEDEDVANQNYPVNFLQKLDASSPKTIILDEDLDDQSPYSSIYRPKFVPKPNEWNSLPTNDKPDMEDPQSLAIVQTNKPDDDWNSFSTEGENSQSLAFAHTTPQLPNEFITESEVDKVMSDLEKIRTSPTEDSVTTLEPTEAVTKSRRRGVWKLVKHRPLDQLEVAESQNYETVLNAFDSIAKVDPYSKSTSNELVKNVDVSTENVEISEFTTLPPSTTKTQENIFDTIYEMFGMFQKPEKNDTSNLNIPTTTFNPTFPEEITEIATTTEEIVAETNTEVINETTTGTIKPSTMPYEIEPWKMKAVKTSTSTEVSHETEICYKGRCVKSREKKKL